MNPMAFPLVVAIHIFLVIAFVSSLFYGSHKSTTEATSQPELLLSLSNAQAHAKVHSTSFLDCSSYIPDQFSEPIGDVSVSYSDVGRLSYASYEISKAVRKLKAPNLRGYTEVEYAILMKGTKRVATFDGRPEQLSEVRFGLFSFLGGAAKQLVVEQTSNKYWRYWIVNLVPNFEIIYDSGKYDLVFELRTIDADKDGPLELVQGLGSFWYILGDNVTSPRQPIILKYHPSIRKYIPANKQFQTFVLQDIDQRIGKGREIKQNMNNSSCYAAIIDVTLRYLYAGKPKEAWAFFEREYNQSDKREQEVALKKLVNKDSVYKAISRRPAT
jgi:hypothetical protein